MAKRKARTPRSATKTPPRTKRGSAARAAQLRNWYGLDFPAELFEFWDWFQGLSKRMKGAFYEPLGMCPGGVLDALAGKFDGRRLRYSPVLHFRYLYDPPEFFTLFTGDSDGLHWGYWFDDPGRLPPAVSSYYARDAYELCDCGPSLWHAIVGQAERSAEGLEEMKEYEPEEGAFYDRLIDDLAALREKLPKPAKMPPRKPLLPSEEGMGVVASDRAAAKKLAAARLLWVEDRLRAFAKLEEAYVLLDRPALAEVTRIHARHPSLPSIDITAFRAGDYHQMSDALEEPEKVRRLTLVDLQGKCPDLGMFTRLEELSLYGNQLTSLPKTLARCVKLKRLNLFRNHLTAIPPVVFELAELRELTLGRNQIKRLGDVNRFLRLKNLRELQLRQNEVSEKQLERLKALLPKAYIV